MSSSHEIPPPFDVSILPGRGSFDLVPVIHEILRTQYCVPGSVFLVEGLEVAPVSKSGRWQAVQLLLGDGHLCIQALMSGPLHRFVHTEEVSVGSYIRVENFHVKQVAATKDGHKAPEMVYLVIEDLSTVGWDEIYRDMWYAETTQAQDETAPIDELDIDEPRLDYVERQGDRLVGTLPADGANGKKDGDKDEDAFEDDFEAFEALTFPLRSSKRREAEEEKQSRANASKLQPIALQRDWHDKQLPLKLTTLRSIPNLPYAQNWSCNVLAIVASLSDVESSYLPPYRQRTARLADPSTNKQVHLSVFLEPENFVPKVGNAVLLVGVKNHRFDGGSLKKYASDAGQAGDWWFEDPVDLGWCDVDGLKRWWAELQQTLSST